jgi:hypothetical protein
MTQLTSFGLNALIDINAQTGTTYTLVLSDAGKMVQCTNASAITLTVPLASSVAFKKGTVVYIAQGGAGQITVSPTVGVTLKKASTTKARAQESVLAIHYLGSDTWRLFGDAA